jgi:hypothetical protein
VTWRPAPHGQPACLMRRRRSWRPSGYACSTTRPCGSVSSPTCPPSCLRPGPPRSTSASPPPRGDGQAHRCQRTVAGGRRGDGPRRRYGLPSGLLRRLGRPSAERHCRTREVMPPPMITTRQRLQCVAHNDSDVASPRPTPASRVGRRTQPPLVVAYSKWSVHQVAATPGRAAARLPARLGVFPIPKQQ